MLNIVVCLKVVNPAIPSGNQFSDVSSSHLVISSFDECALETAIQVKEQYDSRITVVNIGVPESEAAIKKALAMGADEAIQVQIDTLGWMDTMLISRILTNIIKKIGSADLVFFGRQSEGWESGHVGPMVASMLGFHLVSLATEVSIKGNDIHALRQSETGVEIVEVPSASVITVTNADTNIPRIPKMRDIMLSRKKKIVVYDLEDIGLNSNALDPENSCVALESFYVPEQSKVCQIIDGETVDEKAEKLLTHLRTLNLWT